MKAGVLGTFFCLLVLFFIEGSYGGTALFDLYPRLLNRQARQTPPGAVVVEQQQSSASVSGSVTSVAEGNGEPNSALAYSWQGGQTQAGGSQSASADKNNNNNLGTQSQGFSNCLQGYTGNAGNSNSNTANSIGYALCNATFAQSGSQNQNAKARPSMLHGGRPQLPQFGMLPSSPPIVMNYTFGQIGEGISGQTHSSQSTVGGPTGNLMNLFAGGMAHTPQGTMAVHHTAFDPQGKPITASQEFLDDVGINSEEHTILGTGHQQGEVEHSSGGMAHINGLQANTTSFYNSHAEELETKLENN